MKRLVLISILILAFSGIAFADNFTNSAGTTIRYQKITAEASSSAQAVTGRGVFYGIMVKTDGTNNATVSVTDGSVNLIPASTVIPGSTRLALISFDPPLPMVSGAYVTISGTGASFQVLYDN